MRTKDRNETGEEYLRYHERMKPYASVGDDNEMLKMAGLYLAHLVHPKAVEALRTLSEAEPDNVFIALALDECIMWNG